MSKSTQNCVSWGEATRHAFAKLDDTQMALKPRHECGEQVSTTASACAHCGAKPEKKTSLVTWAVFAFIIIVVAKTASPLLTPETLPVPKTPEEIAAEAASEARFQKTVLVAASIKKSMREPESVKWESILTNDDASLVCLEYRARNGFGGMSKEAVSYAKGKFSQSLDVWNKNCAGIKLRDMTHAKRAI